MKFNLTLKALPIAFILMGIGTFVQAQTNYCVSGCNDNAYVKSFDPNTIEYDNMVSVFHSTLIKEADGKVKVWGQGIGPGGTNTSSDHVLTPLVMHKNNNNFPGLTGDILRIAGGSYAGSTLASVVQQFAVLTTDGLFVWGIPNVLISDGIKNTNSFGRVTIDGQANGLPVGVSPGQVKMMFGSYRTLGIVTCTGEAYVLSFIGNKNGDGTSQNSTNNVKWHRVKTTASGNPNLTNVVAMRGTTKGFMALTSGGELYTWGTDVYRGGGASKQSYSYARKMTIPSGLTPKMIGMTQDDDGVSHYLLGTNGDLYAMGENGDRQLGDFTTSDKTDWVRVKKSSATNDFLPNVLWISPNEHDGSDDGGAINVLDGNNKLWAWGMNSGRMLGLPNNDDDYNPTYMPGSISTSYDETKLNLTDNLMAIESGGHTTIAVKDCSMRFGYVGHRVYGSMADGTNVNAYENIYNFGETSIINLCGAPVGPVTQDLRICPDTTADLNDAHLGTIPNGNVLNWYTDPNRAPGTQISDPTQVGPGTYYAFYEPGDCPAPVGSEVQVVLIQAGDPDYASCACKIEPNTIALGEETVVGITGLNRNQPEVGQSNQWPRIRTSGFIALESNSKGFVITRMTAAQYNAMSNPQEGMLVYDLSNHRLVIYSDSAWKVFDTPGCP